MNNTGISRFWPLLLGLGVLGLFVIATRLRKGMAAQTEMALQIESDLLELSSDRPPNTPEEATLVADLLRGCLELNPDAWVRSGLRIRVLTARSMAVSNLVLCLEGYSGQDFGTNVEAWHNWLDAERARLIESQAATEAPAAPEKNEAARTAIAQFQGQWLKLSSVPGGKAPVPVTQIYNGDEATTTLAGRPYFKEKITVDPSKTPKAIDFEITDGSGRAVRKLGIYELDGDRLKLCLAIPGAKRPTDFSGRPEEGGGIVSEWVREKPAGPAGESK